MDLVVNENNYLNLFSVALTQKVFFPVYIKHTIYMELLCLFNIYMAV